MKRIPANPFLLFLPFLLLYAGMIVFMHRDLMEGDEGRYFMYARNLLHGFYSPRGEVFLWNGPGYPIVLMPVIALGLPLIAGTLLNAVFQYLSVVFLYKVLLLFVRRGTALFFSVLWACYYIAFKEMGSLLSEPLANMIISLFMYYAVLAFRTGKKNALIKSGILLGWLALTKVIFGYVLLAMLVLCCIAYLLRRNRIAGACVWIMVISLLVNLPYLFYTWSLTGKTFYWANSGGMSLYWASTPVEGEFGDWNDDKFTAYCGYDAGMPCNAALFAVHHQADYDSIYQYTGVARDEAFRRKAVENIRQYPVKYLKNCLANAGRLFFGFPFSYHYQRFQNIARVPPGAVVLLMFLFSIVFSILNLKRLPFEILFFAGILLFYVGLTLMISAYQRMLGVAVPVIIVWTAFLLNRMVSFRARYE